MLHLRYFASLRDQLQRHADDIPWTPALSSVGAIKQYLLNQDKIWEIIFSQNTILIAVNQQMATTSTPIKDNDEIAFFPPVTGG